MGEWARDKVTKRRRGKERVEWGRDPWSWTAVLAFLPRGPRVPSYATAQRSAFSSFLSM